MPVIPFVSPKGGPGKSTSALLLATFLAKLYDVTVIDADPNHPIQDWASGGNIPPRLTVVSEEDEDTIITRIEDAAEKTPFVIVDLEGTASKIVVRAVSQADFVIIPMQGSHEDAKAAVRGVRLARQSDKPYAVVLTRTSPTIRTRTLADIQKGLTKANISVLRTELNERDAFKALFAFQQTLDGLNPKTVPNIDSAKFNVAEFAQEVIERIIAEQGGREDREPVLQRVGAGL
jgi:chromosome partitioning protein